MHGFTVLSLLASTATLVAAVQETYFLPLSTFNNLAARQQSCAAAGGKPCGMYCMLITDTCCGNGAGACHIGTVCGLAANGIYGCCPIGRNCRGDAPDPSTTTRIVNPRPTTTIDTGDDETSTAAPTTTRAPTSTSTSSKRITPVSSAASSSTAANGGGDYSLTTIPQPTSGSGSGSGSSGSGSGSSGSGSGSSGSGSSNSNSSGGGKSSAGMVRISLATLAGGFIAAVASLL